MTFGEKVLAFYKSLKITKKLPKGVEVLNPYHDEVAFRLCEAFYRKYYSDNHPRGLILGINPGRFGGGVTGIPFTDPIKLSNICGISNNLAQKSELSADFIYKMIEAYGGAERFYGDYFFTSISPLGFTQENKNLNYYDTPALVKALQSFIEHSLETVAMLGVKTDTVFCLGEGTNYKFLFQLNEKKQLFKEIIPLAHPRFIMQYKRKSLDQYINDYIQKLGSKVSH